MTVYELIQELSKYNADDEVQFHVKANYSSEVEAEFDRDYENDIQDVMVETEFNENVNFEGITQPYWNNHSVVIDLKY